MVVSQNVHSLGVTSRRNVSEFSMKVFWPNFRKHILSICQGAFFQILGDNCKMFPIKTDCTRNGVKGALATQFNYVKSNPRSTETRMYFMHPVNQMSVRQYVTTSESVVIKSGQLQSSSPEKRWCL